MNAAWTTSISVERVLCYVTHEHLRSSRRAHKSEELQKRHKRGTKIWYGRKQMRSTGRKGLLTDARQTMQNTLLLVLEEMDAACRPIEAWFLVAR